MQDQDNLLPIESDVKQYLDKELSMFDTHLAAYCFRRKQTNK